MKEDREERYQFGWGGGRQTMIFMAHIMGKPVDISHSKANNESGHCPGPKLLYRLDSRLDHLDEQLFFTKNLP